MRAIFGTIKARTGNFPVVPDSTGELSPYGKVIFTLNFHKIIHVHPISQWKLCNIVFVSSFQGYFKILIKFKVNLYQNNLPEIKHLRNSILTINQIYYKFIFACENGEFCRHRKNNDRISRLNRLSSKVFITCHKWSDQRLFAFLYLF